MLDKENAIADERTIANSEILHAGFDPLRRSLTVAIMEEKSEVLCTLQQRAEENGIQVSLLESDEIKGSERNLPKSITKGLSCEQTMIVYPFEIAIVAMEVA